MNDIYNIMSHHHQPDPVAINGNLEESIPIIFPALIDYDHVNPIFLNHLPSPLEYYDHHHHNDFQHNNDHADQRTTAVVVVGGVGDATAHDLSFWCGDDDDDHEKASTGTLESLVDQATRLVPTCPASAITYYGGNIFKMINDDDMISTCFGYNPQQIISNMATTTPTTMAVNDILVLTNDTHGLKIEHRSRKEKEEEIYAVNNEAVEKDNYAEAVENEHRQASLFTYVAASTTSTQSSVVPDHHTQREGSKKTEKCSTTSSTNQRSKTTILHNKVERKRRNKINQRMEALKRLVPDICHKTDKATIIDQVIEYIKKLQNERDQLKMMSSYGMNNNMTYPMIIPMSSYYMYMRAQQQQQQQQHQMSMMADDAQMGMGVDLGSMHTDPIMHPNLSSTSYWN